MSLNMTGGTITLFGGRSMTVVCIAPDVPGFHIWYLSFFLLNAVASWMRRTGSIRAALTNVEMSDPEYPSVAFASLPICAYVTLLGVSPISCCIMTSRAGFSGSGM
jgi:hypothetical protein